MSRLVVNVAELLQQPGSRRQVLLDEPMEDLRLELARVEPHHPVHLDLVLEAIDGESVHVRGRVAGRYVMTCRRCLLETEVPFDTEVSEVYRPEHDVWEDGYVVREATTVDLGVATAEGVLLSLPPNPVCKPGCAGLCPSCGQNLNDASCDCEVEPGDERWAPLRDLLRE